MLKLLIFDLDGTLADTGQDIADAINHAMEPFGGKRYSVEETRAMVGSGISKLLEELIKDTPPIPPLPRGGEGGVNPKDLVTRRFLDFYAEHLLDNTKAYLHVKDTLARLGNYKKAVLSNKREEYSRHILNELEILEYFDLVWGSDSVREKKPSPVPILDLVEKFGVEREETAIIGDSNYDVDAGRAAGVKVIAATYGFRSRDMLEGADVMIDSFDQLLDVIPKLHHQTEV